MTHNLSGLSGKRPRKRRPRYAVAPANRGDASGIDPGAFGIITSKGGQRRQVQLALKIQF